MMVPRSAKAVVGVYCSPSHRVRIKPTPKVKITATWGDLNLGCVRPNALGITRMRPIAHKHRVAAHPPPLAQAALELRNAMNRNTQPTPQTAVAMRFHGFPPPAVKNCTNRFGPKYTVAAY